MASGISPSAHRRGDLFWLRSIPANWKLRRLKTVLAERTQKGFPDLPLLAATQTKGVVRKEDYEYRTVVAQKDLHLLKLVEVGDFVISLRSFQGGIERAHHRGIISPAYTVLYSRQDSLSEYLAHLFKSRVFLELLRLNVTGIREGQNIDYERLSRELIPVPPPDERTAIVGFLAGAMRRLDEAIAAKKQLVELFEEERQAIVATAATLGVDPSVELANPDVPWLDRVPAHWSPMRAKYLYSESNERTKTGTEERLSVSHLTGVTLRSEKTITMFEAESYVGHKICQPGDLVINTMWAWMGALGVSRHEGLVSPSYGVYRPRSNGLLHNPYADALLRTPMAVSEYTRRSTGIHSSRLRLYPDSFLDVTVYLPPHGEQERIVRHISVETNGLSQKVRHAQRQIELLEEYRTVLIADAVTGRIDLTSGDSRQVEAIAEEVEAAAAGGAT